MEGVGGGGGGGGEDDIVCLDESFFIDDNYQLTTFIFGSQVIELLCLHSASTDFDLTGQLVWPGAMLLNDYLSNNGVLLQGCTVLELGSGVGITGILCSRFCSKVVLTDHNDEVLKILKKNIDLHASSEKSNFCSELVAEKLEWGNSEQICHILQTYTNGFDLILGADICFQQSSICLLFNTVEKLLQARRDGQCKFILAYVSRTKTFYGQSMQEDAFWRPLEQNWAWNEVHMHGARSLDEFEVKTSNEHAKNMVKQIQVARRDRFLEGLTKIPLKTMFTPKITSLPCILVVFTP